jgi:hypothetical protein
LRVAARCLRGGFGIYSIDLHDGSSSPPERDRQAGPTCST